MVAAKYNITMEQGATYNAELDVSEVFPSLTGYSARMQARPTIESSTKYLDLSSDTQGITLDLVNRKITISVPAVTTATHTFSTALYDLELEDGSGNVVRLLEGVITNNLEVTR